MSTARPPQTRASAAGCEGHSENPATGLRTTVCHAHRGTAPSPGLGRPEPAGPAGVLLQDRGRARSDRRCAAPDESAVPFRASLPSGFYATGDAATSLRISLGQPEDQTDGFRQALPTGGFGFELRPPFARQSIEFGFAPGIGLL